MLGKSTINIYPKNDQEFENVAVDLFKVQARELEVYSSYLNALNIDVNEIRELQDIPFLPIRFFKESTVLRENKSPEIVFRSSGTTGNNTSEHYVTDLDFYRGHSLRLFEDEYGSVQDYAILALLPSYIERPDSSLIFMVDHLIKMSNCEASCFVSILDFNDKIEGAIQSSRKVLVIGVSFALLDLAESGQMNLQGSIVMETGGMKGKRAELTRSELHDRLKVAFNLQTIHSEYGMTELLSQAYSKGNGIYIPSSSMRAYTREINDPFQSETNRAGVIQIIDLANQDSCAFIETEDLGKVNPDGSFEILGRMDYSDQRGCNLIHI